MSTMNTRGWRRHEPGPATPLERPTMLTKAIELIAGTGTGRDQLADRAGVTRTDLDLLIPSRSLPSVT